MSELEIPEAAYEAAGREVAAYGLLTASDSYEAASDALRVTAPTIVAAELRRIADEFGKFSAQVFSGMDETARACTGMYAHCAQLLRRRADELDPPTGGETE